MIWHTPRPIFGSSFLRRRSFNAPKRAFLRRSRITFYYNITILYDNIIMDRSAGGNAEVPPKRQCRRHQDSHGTSNIKKNAEEINGHRRTMYAIKLFRAKNQTPETRRVLRIFFRNCINCGEFDPFQKRRWSWIIRFCTLCLIVFGRKKKFSIIDVID